MGLLFVMDQESSFFAFTRDLYNGTAGEVINTTLSFERGLRVVVPVVFGLIAVVGFAGNLLVIVVVVVNTQMRSTTNLLIVCLASADLLFIVVCVPFTAIAYASPVWPFGVTWCKIYQYVIHSTAYLSVYTLVLMSLDRYLAVVHPISSMTLRTRFKTAILILVFYSIIGTLNAISFDDFAVTEYNFFGDVRSACLHIRSVADRAYGRRFYACFFAFAYLVPLALICLLYGLMIHRLLVGRMPRRLAGVARCGAGAKKKTRSNRRVTLMVVVVVVVFAVCWFPIQVMLVVQALEAYPADEPAFVSGKLAANCLAYVNSCVNPILYAFLSEAFRKGFVDLLRCADVEAAAAFAACYAASGAAGTGQHHRPESVELIRSGAVNNVPTSSRLLESNGTWKREELVDK